MAEWKQISKEEVAAANQNDVCEMQKAAEGEVEGQGICRCPVCGFIGHVPGTPRIVTCTNCWNSFVVTWF